MGPWAQEGRLAAGGRQPRTFEAGAGPRPAVGSPQPDGRTHHRPEWRTPPTFDARARAELARARTKHTEQEPRAGAGRRRRQGRRAKAVKPDSRTRRPLSDGPRARNNDSKGGKNNTAGRARAGDNFADPAQSAGGPEGSPPYFPPLLINFRLGPQGRRGLRGVWGEGGAAPGNERCKGGPRDITSRVTIFCQRLVTNIGLSSRNVMMIDVCLVHSHAILCMIIITVPPTPCKITPLILRAPPQKWGFF